MKILITGSSGFVGGALCAKSVAQGWDTTGISRRAAVAGNWIAADLTRPLKLPASYRPDVVVHCAARSSPWGTARDFERQNIDATRHVIDFCRRVGSPHLIYISTSAVLYRNEHQLAMSESTPPADRFLNHYARTKFAGETLVQSYAGPSTILRPRAIFGPGDTVVFPRILRAAREGKFPIIHSATPVMADLIYIETLIDYIVRAIERRATGLFHLSNNRPIALTSFLQDVFTRLDLPAPRRRIPMSRAMTAGACIETLYRFLPFLGEPPITRFGVSVFAYSKTMDVTKSLRELGPPSVSLDEGVERFVRWQKTQT